VGFTIPENPLQRLEGEDPAFGTVMKLGRGVRATLPAGAPPPTPVDALAVESLQASVEEGEEEPLTKEEEEDDSLPAADPEPPGTRGQRPPPPDDVQMRRQLCEEDPEDPDFVPFSLQQLLFRAGRFGRNELRALWAAQFAPSLHKLVTTYRVVPPEIADILLGLTSDGADLLGAGIFLNVDHASLPQHLRDRIDALHRAYGLPYLAKIRDLIVSLSGLRSDGMGKARREVWLDMREVLLVQWLGVLRGRTLAFADQEGTRPYAVEVETFPGTFIIRWIKVRRRRRWSLISTLKKLSR
jgi:hypothetical protein